MTAAGNTSTERTFCRNHELRVVSTLDSSELSRPREVSFLFVTFSLDTQRKSKSIKFKTRFNLLTPISPHYSASLPQVQIDNSTLKP